MFFTGLFFVAQLGRGQRSSGFVAWLVDKLIHPDHQGHPAAAQTAENVFYWTLLAVVLSAVAALVWKLWWERRVLDTSMHKISHGPSRTRIVLVVGLFVFTLLSFVSNLIFVSRFVQLMGLGNVAKVTAFGALAFMILFLLLLTLAGYWNHMFWRRVK